MRCHGKIVIASAFLLVLTASPLVSTADPLKPEELSPPRITSPLYEGAEVVEVWGFDPEAKVTIYADGADIGGGSCWFTKCTFNVNKIAEKQKITATQTVDGVPSDPTRDEYAVTVQKLPDQSLDPKYKKERLLAPAIDSPLFECQGVVPVKNVVEGALVQVFSASDINNPIGKTKTPWSYARPRTTELQKDQKIVANQKLFFSNASDLSPEEPVKAKPTQLPKPIPDETDLVVGSEALTIRNLWIGAKVDIYYEEAGKARESLGGGFAPWPGTIFPIKPLKAAWVGCAGCIKVDQSLCDIKATSSGNSVKDILDPPTIRAPICAGSSEVTICNTVPKSRLKIFRKGNPDKQVGQQGAIGSCTPVTLGGKLDLNNGDEIYATQEVGALKSESLPVRVVDKSAPIFEIENGEFCTPCSGQDYGPVFVRDTLTNTNNNGPVFRATMCGAEKAIVDVRNPNNALIESITLEEIKGVKGYLEGSWDWNKIGWKTPQDIPLGKYRATFKIWPNGPGLDKYFFVTTGGCIEWEALCPHNKYTVVSEYSGKCVSLPIFGGYDAGDPVEQWDCSHYHMGLQGAWLFEPEGTTNTYRVVSIYSGMCLEVKTSAGDGKNNGDPLQQEKCTGADNQKWLVVTDSVGISTFKSVYSGKCMQIRFGNTGGKQDGDAIEQWDCVAGAKHQTWKLGEITAPNPPLDTGKGELCNVCNPANPDCKPGALCMVMPSGQSICGQSCSATVSCPAGYTCIKITQLGQTFYQCVPLDNQCPR